MREFSEIGRPLTVRYEEARQSIVDNYKGSVDEKAADILLVRSLKKKADAEDAYELPNDLRILVRTLTLSEEQIKVLVTNIRCPLLIIRASNGLKNFTEDVLKEYLDIYQASSADFRIVNVAGSHHVHLTHPERVAPHIHEFLLPLASFPTSKLWKRDTDILDISVYFITIEYFLKWYNTIENLLENVGLADKVGWIQLTTCGLEPRLVRVWMRGGFVPLP